MATAPSATPHVAKRSGPGCLFMAIAFPLVILAGVVVGTALDDPEEAPEEVHVVVAEGTIGTTEWRVDAVQDVEGELCAFLYADGAQLTGGCGVEPDDATFVDETVVFGRVDGTAASVEVVLSNAEVVEADTVEAEGLEGRWYAVVVPGDVDVEKLQTP